MVGAATRKRILEKQALPLTRCCHGDPEETTQQENKVCPPMDQPVHGLGNQKSTPHPYKQLVDWEDSG